MGSSPELEIVIKMEQWYEVQVGRRPLLIPSPACNRADRACRREACKGVFAVEIFRLAPPHRSWVKLSQQSHRDPHSLTPRPSGGLAVVKDGHRRRICRQDGREGVCRMWCSPR